MTRPDEWIDAEPVQTARLSLEPLTVTHAVEMAPLLDDPDLHEFIGGRPASLDELRRRYSRQVAGRSDDGAQGWLNWVVRLRSSSEVVGTVQATLERAAGSVRAEIAWVVASPYQGQGYAGEAAAGMLDWLRRHGVRLVIAHVHPRHDASAGVARRLGMRATDQMVDGEVRWESRPADD